MPQETMPLLLMTLLLKMKLLPRKELRKHLLEDREDSCKKKKLLLRKEPRTLPLKRLLLMMLPLRKVLKKKK